jgi:hypothetical protein
MRRRSADDAKRLAANFVIGRLKQLAMIPFLWSRAALVASVSLLFGGLLPAQTVHNDLSAPLLQASDHSDARRQPRLPPLRADPQGRLGGTPAGAPSAADSRPSSAIEGQSGG